MTGSGGLRRAALPGLAGALLVAACSSDVKIEGTGAGGQGGAGTTSSPAAQNSTIASASSGPDTASSTGVGAAPTTIVECQSHIYECGDLVDNDGDGLTDSFDPECFGPCDNSEADYSASFPTTGTPCKRDCHFDFDSGSGNDDCYWDHRCDTHEVAPDYYPEPSLGGACEYAGPDAVVGPPGMTCSALAMSQSATCLDYCGPITPNGCDCFGCCELPAGSGAYVFLSSTGVEGSTLCTPDDLDDPTICHPCDPVPSCSNLCDPCEVCIGKPAPDVGCNVADQCEPGAQPCGLNGQLECPPESYCVTGCCRAAPQ